jgi:hypothetical protein
MFGINWIENHKLNEKLGALRSIPPRNPAEAQRRRAAFLSEVAEVGLLVSKTSNDRHKGWKNPFQKKEFRPMFTSIVAAIVAITLALGGAGVTVVAAQSALPGEALYGIKTASEDVRLALSGEATQLALNLEFSERRIEEISALKLGGQEVPEEVLDRLQAQIQNAFQIAAAQEDPLMLQTLEQLRARLQDQEALCTQLEEQNQNHGLDQIKDMIQERIRLVENGLQDPQAFREQVGDGLNRPEDQIVPGEGGPSGPHGTPGADEPAQNAGEGSEDMQNSGSGGGDTQQGPQAGTGEPQQSPVAGTAEPQGTPGSGTGEPQQTPKGTDPQGTPGSGTCEPQQTPGSGTGEPQQTPGSGGKP